MNEGFLLALSSSDQAAVYNSMKKSREGFALEEEKCTRRSVASVDLDKPTSKVTL